MARAKFIVAAFIGVLSFIAIAVLGVIAPAGIGTDWLIAAIGGVLMGSAAYFIISSHAKRYRLIASVTFGLVLVAVLILGFSTQVLAAMETGLIGAVLTYLIYPIVVGKRRLAVKLAVISVAALILIAAFAILDPITYVNPGSVSITNVKNGDNSVAQGCAITPSPIASNAAKPQVINLTTADSIKFSVPYHLTAYDHSVTQFYTTNQAEAYFNIYDKMGTTTTVTTGTLANGGGVVARGADAIGQLSMPWYPTVGQHSLRVFIYGDWTTNAPPFYFASASCQGNSYYTVNVASSVIGGGGGGGGGPCRIACAT